MVKISAMIDRFDDCYHGCLVERIPLPSRSRPSHHHRSGGDAHRSTAAMGNYTMDTLCDACHSLVRARKLLKMAIRIPAAIFDSVGEIWPTEWDLGQSIIGTVCQTATIRSPSCHVFQHNIRS